MIDELDLNNPIILEQLKAADVMAPPVADPVADYKVEQAIKLLQKGATFSFKLTAAEILQVEREAASVSLGWKEYLEQRIRSELLNGAVGRPTISAPSFAKGDRVTGVTGAVRRG